MKLTNWLLGLVGWLVLAGQTQALVFVIDDFNMQDPGGGIGAIYTITDVSADNVVGIQNTGNSSSAIPDASNTVWEFADDIGGPLDIADNPENNNTATRDIYAELDFGGSLDNVETQVCQHCNAGHFVSDATATGNGSWIYTGTSVDVSPLALLKFHYAADLDGYSMDITFDWDNQTKSQTKSFNLAGTGGANILNPANRASFLAPLSLWDSADFTDLTSARFDVLGVENLDFSIDSIHLAAVPEPTTLALMGLGLAGIGYRRHRSKKVA